MTQFADSRFMTAAEKQRVLRDWRRFLETLARQYEDKDRCFRAFSARLYQHLMQHCSFIAHYNRVGFFDTYFVDGDQTLEFLRQFDVNANPEGDSAEYGGNYWLSGDYTDINEAMREAANPFVADVVASARTAQRTSDLAEAELLAGRHGYRLSR